MDKTDLEKRKSGPGDLRGQAWNAPEPGHSSRRNSLLPELRKTSKTAPIPTGDLGDSKPDCQQQDERRELASWLISHRNEIEASMNDRLGPAAPQRSSPEAEALRRFRTFTSSALMRGSVPPPALDGLRVNQRRTEALLLAWVEAAATVSPLYSSQVRKWLGPLAQQFRIHLRGTQAGRKSKGAPRAKRRAIVAAIDRIAEAFLAIDTDTGNIEDANPAAGALFSLNRDELLGVDAMSFVPKTRQSGFWRELDAIGEGVDRHEFTATFCDSNGTELELDASATRYSTRGKTFALLLLRPKSTGRVIAPETPQTTS